MLVLMLDASPREAEPFTGITRRCRAVRSLPLAPISLPLIPSRQCAAFIEKSELTTGGSLPLSCLPPVPIPIPIPIPILDPLLPAPRSDHVLNRPGLGIRSPWTSMNHLFLSDIASEIDEKLFVIKYEFSYICR
jgi:hypothetical protein